MTLTKRSEIPDNSKNTDNIITDNITFNDRTKVKLYFPSKITFSSHRSGWNYALNSLLPITSNSNNNAILCEDFIEKTFSWGRPPSNKKKVNLDDKIWEIEYDDLRTCPSSREINMTQCVKVEDNIIIRWCNIIQKWELYEICDFDYELLERSYSKPITYEQPWIGFWHNPPDLRGYISSSDVVHTPQNILMRKEFQKSLEYCKGIFVFSKTMGNWVEKIFSFYNYKIPVSVLIHPTEIIPERLCFSHSNSKILLQVGSWLRDCLFLFKLKIRMEKVWIIGDENALTRLCNDIFLTKNIEFYETAKKITNILENGYEKNKIYNLTHDVSIIKLSNEKYDNFLSKNIVITNVKGSSTNNGLIECIARKTPIFINKIDAVREYLGEDYPMYYNNINEIQNIINSDNLDNLIIKTSEYLSKYCPVRDKLSGEYFLESVLNSEVINSFIKQQRNNCFPILQKKNNNSIVSKKLDFVITWVDSTSTKWKQAKQKYFVNINSIINDSISDNRFRSLYDELKYCLRSIYSCCSCVGKVFLVVHNDQELPAWLNITKINIVRHKDIFYNNKGYYNSLAIESNLHNIKGLSENFVYMNDDTFLLGYWKYSDFIDNCKLKFYVSNIEIGKEINNNSSSFDYLWHNTHKQLDQLFPNHINTPRPKLEHAPYILNKYVLKKLSKLSSVKLTSKSIIRGINDIGLVCGLHQYYQFFNSKNIMDKLNVCYSIPSILAELQICAIPPEARILCIQDDFDNVNNTEIIKNILFTLEQIYQIPSIYEII